MIVINPRTSDDLAKLCLKWQRILRLQDWTIYIRFARHYEISANVAGEVDVVVLKKTARISIIEPIDYHNQAFCAQDIEKTVVHELLHLHFAQHDAALTLTTEEQAVESLACAFVGLTRFWDNPNE